MRKKLSWLFNGLTFVGVVPVTLMGLNIGRDVMGEYLYWFVGSLWIGLIGSAILKRIENKSA